MPESTFLQIDGGDNPTPRMIELPPGPVRIGRGAHCEVRLGDPGLGDVQCMLRRRGTAWHFQPVGPPGKVWIEGRAADRQVTLRLGVPFRVGDHWLTLRPADSAFNDWGTFDAPIAVEPEAEAPPPATTIGGESAPGPSRPRPPAPTGDDEERLRRWEARLEQRERWLKDRQDERRWEARWKSAGESIRARSTTPSAKPPAAARSTPPTPPPASSPRMPPRPTQTPPVARIIDPRGPEPLRRVVDPTPRPSAPRVVVRPLPDPPALKRKPADPMPFEVDRASPTIATPPAPKSRALVTLPTIPAPAGRPEVAEPATPSSEVASAAPAPPDLEVSGPSALLEVLAKAPEPEAAVSEIGPIEALAFEPEAEGSVDEPVPVEVPVGRARVEFESPGRPGIVPLATEPLPIPPEVRPVGPAEGRASGMTPESGSPRSDWPSARSIFAAQGRRAAPAPVEASPKARRSPEPRPTEALGPACWSMPLWLGWFPALVASVTVGVAGVALSYEWAVEAGNANFAIRMALRPEGMPGNAIDPSLIPRGGWWASTAPHLSAWAMALVRAGDGEDHSEDVRSLMNASRHASRLGSRSRFVVEWPEAAEPGAPPDLSHLGRTRDVVTLVWTGRRLRKEGKMGPATRAYRSAMEIASRTTVGDLDPPSFFEDPQVRRYALPREAMLGLVAKAMAEDGDWTVEQWAEALPPSAAASHAASRVFAGMQRRADADRLADLAIRQAESPPPPGFDEAEERAAGAEALAYRLRWREAAEQYRRAIDLVEDDATRRRWWLNLAEVAQRVGDDAGRVRAVEAAKAPTTVDEVTRRALKYQQGLPGLASSGPRR